MARGGEPSALVVSSIAFCVSSIAYLVASTELDVDTSLHYRTHWSSVHGYFRRDAIHQGVLMLGILLFVAGYLSAKLIALVVLASASMPAAVGWCTAEALVLHMLRYFAEGRVWRFHLQEVSNLLPSLVVHVMMYVAMLAAPFPVMRYHEMLNLRLLYPLV